MPTHDILYLANHAARQAPRKARLAMRPWPFRSDRCGCSETLGAFRHGVVWHRSVAQAPAEQSVSRLHAIGVFVFLIGLGMNEVREGFISGRGS